MIYAATYDEDFLQHHGISGMKWGVRRYQNEDGSLTPAGEERYYSETDVRKNGIRDRVGSDEKQRYEKSKDLTASYNQKLEQKKEATKTKNANKHLMGFDSFADYKASKSYQGETERQYYNGRGAYYDAEAEEYDLEKELLDDADKLAKMAFENGMSIDYESYLKVALKCEAFDDDPDTEFAKMIGDRFVEEAQKKYENTLLSKFESFVSKTKEKLSGLFSF